MKIPEIFSTDKDFQWLGGLLFSMACTWALAYAERPTSWQVFFPRKRRSKGVIVERLKVDVPQPHYSDGLLLDLASSWLNTSSLLAFCRSPSWRTRLIRGGDSYFELITYLLLLKYYYNYCWGKTILHTARKYMRYF